jgi:cytochrome d ubiquinol oxidase subunit II
MATAVLVLVWIALTAYALLAGADFGAGTWDLLAGTATSGKDRRKLIEHVIGPVWEANHVWLIFVLVLLWTCFPTVFAAAASTLWVPLTLAALGIIARGSAFAFRKAVTTLAQQRLFGATFALSSVVTPFFLGAAAGAIGAGRVPPGVAAGDWISSWTGPVPILTGLLAVTACSYLAATYLCGDAVRLEHEADWFRTRSIVAGVVTGAVSLAGLPVVAHDAPDLYDGLTGGRGLPLVAGSVLAGALSFLLVISRRYLFARIAAGLAVTALLWGWALAQYPELLPGLEVTQAKAPDSTLTATLITSAIGLALLIPSMWWLFHLFQQPEGHASDVNGTPLGAGAVAGQARDGHRETA